MAVHSQLFLALVLLTAATPVMNGELADDNREVLELVSTASPLTKQKTVRCFKENIKMDDGKNFEIEHIKKNEDLVESVQRTGRNAPDCVVLTSVREDPGDRSQDMTGVRIIPQQHDFVPPSSNDFGVAVPDIFNGLYSGSRYGVPGPDLAPPSLKDTGVYPAEGSYGYGTPSPNSFLPPSLTAFNDGGLQQQGVDSNGDVIKTYQVSTNMRKQESYDHHAFAMERGPGVSWRYGVSTSGNGPPAGANGGIEASANDVDQKFVNDAPSTAATVWTLVVSAIFFAATRL